MKFLTSLDVFHLYAGFIFSSVAFRYEDFFRGEKEKGSKRKAQLLHESEDSGDEDDMEFDKPVSLSLSLSLCYVYDSKEYFF